MHHCFVPTSNRIVCVFATESDTVWTRQSSTLLCSSVSERPDADVRIHKNDSEPLSGMRFGFASSLVSCLV